jgi:hypothetical protein
VADTITPTPVAQTYHCGSDYMELKVINFEGPDDSKACAYCCNMNLDFDGEPQAYAPLNSTLNPWDVLGDAGFLSSAANAAKKAKFDSIKNQIDALKTQKAAAKTPPEASALQKKIEELEASDIIQGYKGATNYGKIFWHWYAVMGLTPGDAATKVYHEKVGDAVQPRKPLLVNDPKAKVPNSEDYEDVYGKFPVIQSEFEPGKGKGYFVTTMPGVANPSFPAWDQRFYLPPGEVHQGPYGALTVPYPGKPGIPSLAKETGLQVQDSIFAMRLDKQIDLTFPFRDAGYGAKVGECSIDAYTALGGTVDNTKVGWAKYNNSFLVLYLAFPNRQTPQTALGSFAKATNALDFAVILAFMAQVTAGAKAKKLSDDKWTKVPGGDALTEFKKWQKLDPDKQIRPVHFGIITRALRHAGFNPPNLPNYSPGPIPVP